MSILKWRVRAPLINDSLIVIPCDKRHIFLRRKPDRSVVNMLRPDFIKSVVLPSPQSARVVTLSLSAVYRNSEYLIPVQPSSNGKMTSLVETNTIPKRNSTKLRTSLDGRRQDGWRLVFFNPQANGSMILHAHSTNRAPQKSCLVPKSHGLLQIVQLISQLNSLQPLVLAGSAENDQRVNQIRSA